MVWTVRYRLGLWYLMPCDDRLLLQLVCAFTLFSFGVMVSFRTSVTTFVAFFSLFGSLYAVPLAEKLERLSPPALDLLKRSTPAAPHFLAYNDAWLSQFPSASDLKVSEKRTFPCRLS